MDAIESSLGVRSATTPQTRGDVPWGIILSALAIIVTLIVTAVGATHVIDQQIAALGLRVSKNESAIEVLGHQQSEQTQKLIHDLLSMAKTSDDPKVAAKAAQTASLLTASLRQQKRSATPEFFAETNDELNSLRLKNEPSLRLAAFTTQQQLAEYRSALQPQKQTGTSFTCTPNFANKDAFGTMPSGPSHLIANITVIGCPQSLDGFTWQNVVFVNSRISYRGGPVILDKVTFVNCSFQIEQNEEGTRLLQYAALDQNNLEIRPKFFNPS